jgi:hypothetical protein
MFGLGTIEDLEKSGPELALSGRLMVTPMVQYLNKIRTPAHLTADSLHRDSCRRHFDSCSG